MTTKEIKDLNKRNNAKEIKYQYVVPYRLSDTSFYKHIDELTLEDNITIKATLGPIDLSVLPFSSTAAEVVQYNRIDLIATKHYGKASMWRALAYMNNLADPLNLKEGQVLLIPSITDLKRFPNPLS